jgi:F-type H+-transporting ATPase subunit delta
MASNQNHEKIARRYAKALFEAIRGAEHADYAKTLLLLAAQFEDSPELREALSNPSYKTAERVAVLEEIAAKILPNAESFKRFLSLLVEKSRIGVLPAIAKSFAEMVDKSLGRVKVEITTATQLDEAGRQSVLSQMKGSKNLGDVQASWSVDQGILGGVVIKIGDALFDGSVKGTLESMKEKFLA